MHEAAWEARGERAVDRLDELAIQCRGIDGGGILLQPHNGPRRPEGILGVEIAAVEERHVRPESLLDRAEKIGEAEEDFGRALRLIHQIHDALTMAAQQSVQIGGPEFRGVAHRESPFGGANQSEAEFHVFPEPGIVAIQSQACHLIQRQAPFLTENAVRKHPHLAAGDTRQPGDRHLPGTGAANHIVIDDFALAQQAEMVVEERLRIDLLRREVVQRSPRLAGLEFLHWEPAHEAEAHQRP